jgi:hypothetical protein
VGRPTDDELRNKLPIAINEMWKDREHVEAERSLGFEFTSFLNGLPVIERAAAVRFIEWSMIGEALGRDWGEATESDDITRQRHMNFLVTRLGNRLKNIAQPIPLPAKKKKAPAKKKP